MAYGDDHPWAVSIMRKRLPSVSAKATKSASSGFRS